MRSVPTGVIAQKVAGWHVRECVPPNGTGPEHFLRDAETSRRKGRLRGRSWTRPDGVTRVVQASRHDRKGQRHDKCAKTGGKTGGADQNKVRWIDQRFGATTSDD